MTPALGPALVDWSDYWGRYWTVAATSATIRPTAPIAASFHRRSALKKLSSNDRRPTRTVKTARAIWNITAPIWSCWKAGRKRLSRWPKRKANWLPSWKRAERTNSKTDKHRGNVGWKPNASSSSNNSNNSNDNKTSQPIGLIASTFVWLTSLTLHSRVISDWTRGFIGAPTTAISSD